MQKETLDDWCNFVIFPWLWICLGDNTPPLCFHTATELSRVVTIAKSILTLWGCYVGYFYNTNLLLSWFQLHIITHLQTWSLPTPQSTKRVHPRHDLVIYPSLLGLSGSHDCALQLNRWILSVEWRWSRNVENSHWCCQNMSKTMCRDARHANDNTWCFQLCRVIFIQLKLSLWHLSYARLWHTATILYLRIARLDSCWKCWTRTQDAE